MNFKCRLRRRAGRDRDRDASRPRARREGELPGGIAMVSFAYSGAPGRVVGAAGEWLELVSPI